MPDIIIRPAEPSDHQKLWELFKEVIEKGDSYVFTEDTSQADFEKFWLGSGVSSFVAVKENEIVGTYMMKPNQVGRGSHVANCGYITAERAQGLGVGSKMCEHSILEGKKQGYRALQFNLVISTNEPAIHLWKKHGFEIIGTIPKAFDHKTLGYVDALIMWRDLTD